MGKAVQSSSSNGMSRLATAALLLLAGCAGSAPSLPPDTTSVNRSRTLTLADFAEADRTLSCDAIGNERRQIADTVAAANARIEANRTKNQVAGYFAGLFIVPAIATEGNYAEKDEIARLSQRKDTLIQLASVKGCTATN
jgi:hypothetical protein